MPTAPARIPTLPCNLCGLAAHDAADACPSPVAGPLPPAPLAAALLALREAVAAYHTLAAADAPRRLVLAAAVYTARRDVRAAGGVA
jgi:hypothetical protein